MSKIWKDNNMIKFTEDFVSSKEPFVQYCKNYIIDNIDDYAGQSVYGADLGSTLTEGPNVNGSITMNRNEAKEYLENWWDDASDYYDYHKSNFGEDPTNPFSDPEGYMVLMVIEGVNSIMSRCPVVDENWNNTFELTPKVIRQIKKYVVSFNEETLF